jgi:Domain of unknown function (DUF4382)
VRRRCALIILFFCLTMAILVLSGCGSNVGINSGGGGAINCGGCGSTGGNGGGGNGTTTNGPVALTIVDPPTCASPRFSFSHIYVAVKSVQLSPTANADQTSNDWVEAAPALNTSPRQIDLFAAPTIGNLSGGTNVSVATGTYRSARLVLASNGTIISGNQCGAAANCAIVGAQTIPLDVAAESSNGIFMSGTTLQSGQVVVGTTPTNLNFLFDSCASVLSTSSSTMRLIPKVFGWAGAISTWSVGLSDATTGSRIGSSDGLIAFEQADASGVFRVVAQAATDGAGNATLYMPPGVYDVVAAATAPSGGTAAIIYSPMVIAGVDSVSGTNSLSVSLPQAGPALPATINGTISAQTSALGPDVQLGVLQKGTFNGGISQPYTIPILADFSSTTNGTTVAGGGCTAGSACSNYTLQVSGQPLFLRTFTDPTATASSSANSYTVDAIAYRQSSGGLLNCTSPEQTTSTDINNATLILGPGATATAAPLNFIGCQ